MPPPSARDREQPDQDEATPRKGSAKLCVRALFAGLVYAACMAVSYEPVGVWWFAFLAPAPLMALALRPGLSPSRAGMYAALGAVPWWAFAHVWTLDMTRAGIYPLTLYLSMYVWAFVWIAGRVRARCARVPGVVVLAVVWSGLEFARGAIVFTGYGFYLTPHPVMNSPGAALAMPAAYIGAYGVTVLVALVAAGIAVVVIGRARGVVPGVVAVVIAAAGFGVSGVVGAGGASSGASTRFAVVQSNIPQDNRMQWTFRRRVADWFHLRDLTVQAVGHDPEVIVWPEGMVPGRTLDPVSLETERASTAVWPMAPTSDDDAPGLEIGADYIAASAVADELLATQRLSGVPMIVGAAAYDGFRIEREGDGLRYAYDRMYNTAFVLQGGRAQTPWYDKLHLAPFGEVMPYISSWEWLEQKMLAVAARGMTFALSEGNAPVVLEAEKADGSVVRAATPICFEATVPAVCRELVFEGGQRRADVLVNITNDGWFAGSTSGREVHLLASRWRCVELATPMVRAANTGISGAYDARGRVIEDRVTLAFGDEDARDPARDPPRDRVAGVVVAEVPHGSGATVYARTGDVVGWACFGGMVLMAVGSFVSGRGNGPAGRDASPGGAGADERG